MDKKVISVLEKYAASTDASMDKDALFGWGKQPSQRGDQSRYPEETYGQGDKVLSGPQIRNKVQQQAKITGNHYDTLVTTVAGAGMRNALKALETAAPKAYEFVNKYLIKWSTEGDKLNPAGGLSSKEASEEKEAAFGFPQENANSYLVKMIDDFSKKYPNAPLLNDELTNAFNQFKTVLEKNKQTIRDPKEAPKDNAIKAFLDALDKVINKTKVYTSVPPELKKDLNNMISGLNSMLSDTAKKQAPAAAPAPAPVSPAPVQQKTQPAQPSVPPKSVTPTNVSGKVPAGANLKESADKSNNILISEGIEMTPSIMEIDASSDEILKLEKVLLNNIN